MDEGDAHDSDFASEWLAEQQRFWRGWAQGVGDADLGAAHAAWGQACEQWWREVAGAVPAPLGAPLEAALEQTRLCLSLIGGARDPLGPEGPANPARIFAAALDALGDAPHGNARPSSAEAEYLRAFQRYVDALSAIARAGLGRVRARLAEERPDSPAGVYAIHVEEIEDEYRTAAAGDAFARVVGDLVNARVELLAERAARRS